MGTAITGIECPDLEVAPDAWWEREGARGRVRCRAAADRVWQLTCKAGKWEGHVGNCSGAPSGEL